MYEGAAVCICVCVCVCARACAGCWGGGVHMPRRRRTPGTFARAYLLRPNGPSPPLGVKRINRGTAISSNKLTDVERFIDSGMGARYCVGSGTLK